MEKEALFYKKLARKIVRCELCPHFCTIKPGKRGKCGARENQDGRLVSLVYSRPCSIALDPIEKKPFYHFYPGRMTLTLATVGCNLSCKHCQNWQISQAEIEQVPSEMIIPEKIIDLARQYRSDIISFSYTEPTIFYEYMLDIAKLAKEKGLKCTMVSNGFINLPPLKKIMKYVDAFNIDLKAINESFYKRFCGARLAPVLETLKSIYKAKKHLEITNLIIPTLNDKERDIKKLVRWIIDNLDADVPLHFSAYYPCYKAKQPATPASTVIKACEIARKMGMKRVYSGNI